MASRLYDRLTEFDDDVFRNVTQRRTEPVDPFGDLTEGDKALFGIAYWAERRIRAQEGNNSPTLYRMTMASRIKSAPDSSVRDTLGRLFHQPDAPATILLSSGARFSAARSRKLCSSTFSIRNNLP